MLLATGTTHILQYPEPLSTWGIPPNSVSNFSIGPTNQTAKFYKRLTWHLNGINPESLFAEFLTFAKRTTVQLKFYQQKHLSWKWFTYSQILNLFRVLVYRFFFRSTSWCENRAGVCEDGTSWSSHVRIMDETMWRVAASKSVGAQQRSKECKMTWWLVSFCKFFLGKGIRDRRNKPSFFRRWLVWFFVVRPCKTNMSPDKWWLEDYVSFEMVPFPGDIRWFSRGD